MLDHDVVAHPADRLIAEYEPSDEELEANRDAVDELAEIEAWSRCLARLEPWEKRHWIVSGKLMRAARMMVAGGYEVHESEDLLEASPDHTSPCFLVDTSPDFTFSVAAAEALFMVGLEPVEHADVRAPLHRHAPVLAVVSKRRARGRETRTRPASVAVASRGDPSRPRPADDDDLASRHAAGVAA